MSNHVVPIIHYVSPYPPVQIKTEMKPEIKIESPSQSSTQKENPDPARQLPPKGLLYIHHHLLPLSASQKSAPNHVNIIDMNQKNLKSPSLYRIFHPMDACVTAIFNLAPTYLKHFLDPKVKSFKLTKSQNGPKLDMFNRVLFVRWKEWEAENLAREERGQETGEWYGAPPLDYEFAFQIIREGNIVKFGSLCYDGSDWGEACLTYCGNDDLREFDLVMVEEFYDVGRVKDHLAPEAAMRYAMSVIMDNIPRRTDGISDIRVVVDGVEHVLDQDAVLQDNSSE